MYRYRGSTMNRFEGNFDIVPIEDFLWRSIRKGAEQLQLSPYASTKVIVGTTDAGVLALATVIYSLDLPVNEDLDIGFICRGGTEVLGIICLGDINPYDYLRGLTPHLELELNRLLEDTEDTPQRWSVIDVVINFFAALSEIQEMAGLSPPQQSDFIVNGDVVRELRRSIA